MIVSGKPLAQKILEEVRLKIADKKLHPNLAIILAGNHPASRTYIKHKTIIGDEIGIHVTTYEFSPADQLLCKTKINELNSDPLIQGIIVQLPLYPGWESFDLVNMIAPQKDVDGFIPGSPFIPATAEGTWEMLKEFARIETQPVDAFLKNKSIVVLGKGKTAGKPIRDLLEKHGNASTLVDSKTLNPNDIIRRADIIISATGKKHIINAANVKEGAYVMGIGVGKEEIDGKEKTFGDVDEKGVENKAKLLCPTIGGIGPLTIACLLRNVYTASTR